MERSIVTIEEIVKKWPFSTPLQFWIMSKDIQVSKLRKKFYLLFFYFLKEFNSIGWEQYVSR